MEILTIQQIKQLEFLEFNNKILEVKEALFNLKFKQATKKSIKTHLLKQHRRMLAQLLTIQTEIKK